MPSRVRKGRVRSFRAPLAFIDPALPVLVPKPPSGPDWIHEIKHDGYRMQIHVRPPGSFAVSRRRPIVGADRVRLYTMTGVDWTERYPLVVAAAANLDVDRAVLDAEVVIVGDDGKPSFNALVERVHEASAIAWAFDLLQAEGRDARGAPIEDRRAALQDLIAGAGPGLHFSEHADAEFDGPTVYAHACKLGLEGIVSKRKGSRYRSGKCPSWVKTRNPKSPAAMRIADGSWS